MNKIKILLKNEFLLVINRISKMPKRKKIGMFVLIGFIILAIFAQTFSQSFLMLDVLVGSGLENTVLDQQVTMVLLFSFVFMISNGMTVSEKDSDLLLSMPITKSQILASKTGFKFIIDFAINFILLVPATIIYTVMVSKSVLTVINAIIVSILLSLIFVGIEHLFNTLINAVAVRFKYYKAIKVMIMTLVLLGSLGLYYYSIFNSVGVSGEIKRTIIVKDITDIIVSNQYLDLLLLAIYSVSVFVIGILVFSMVYGKKPKSYKNHEKELKQIKQKSLLKTLILKEFKTYFNTTAWLFNTIIGYVFLIGASVGLFFVEFDGEYLKIMAYFVTAFCLSTCCTSNTSLSLEGKRFWIYKSLPIDYKKIVYSKALMNFVLVFITSTIAIVMTIISNKFNILFVLLLYLMLLSSGLVVSFVGIIVNMLFPKLDYENETAVVKQSASVAISMLPFMVVFMLFPALYFLLTFKQIAVNLNLIIVLNILFNLIVFIVSILFINKKSHKILGNL